MVLSGQPGPPQWPKLNRSVLAMGAQKRACRGRGIRQRSCGREAGDRDSAGSTGGQDDAGGGSCRSEGDAKGAGCLAMAGLGKLALRRRR